MSQPASNQPYITRITLLQLGLLTLPWLVWLTRVASNHPNAEHLALCLMNCTRRMNSALDPSAPPPAPDYSDLVSFPLCGCQLRPLLELPVADYRLPGACHIEAIFSHTTRSGFLSWSPYYLINEDTLHHSPSDATLHSSSRIIWYQQFQTSQNSTRLFRSRYIPHWYILQLDSMCSSDSHPSSRILQAATVVVFRIVARYARMWMTPSCAAISQLPCPSRAAPAAACALLG